MLRVVLLKSAATYDPYGLSNDYTNPPNLGMKDLNTNSIKSWEYSFNSYLLGTPATDTELQNYATKSNIAPTSTTVKVLFY